MGNTVTFLRLHAFAPGVHLRSGELIDEPEAAVSVTAGEGAVIAAALPGDASPTEPDSAASTVHEVTPTPTDAGEGQWPPASIVAATATIAPVEPSVSSLLTTAPGAPPFDDMPDLPAFLDRRSAA